MLKVVVMVVRAKACAIEFVSVTRQSEAVLLAVDTRLASHEQAVTECNKDYNACTAGYLSFGPMARCAVHALN